MIATNNRLPLALYASTAADVMTPSPVSIREDASIQEARALFTKKGFRGAPVIDVAGRPVGVVTCSDLMIHDCAKATKWSPEVSGVPSKACIAEVAEETVTVGDIMTPAVFSVAPGTPISMVIRELLGLHVHHLFVVDEDGTLLGAISPLDIIRRLAPET